MRWIGLTGGIASGKSTVSARLRARGFAVLDADGVSRELTGPGGLAVPLIAAAFGSQVLGPDGALDRLKLGKKVFGQPEQLQKLENILHPLIRQQIAAEKARLQNAGCPVAFYDVPLLYEKKMQADFEAVILVSSTVELQRSRMQSRDSLSLEEIDDRLRSQIPLAEKELQTPYVIRNIHDLAFLDSELERVLQLLKIR